MERSTSSSTQRRGLAALGVAGLLLAACGGSNDGVAEGETITLTVANFNHANAPETRAVDWWLDEIEARTEGRVVFERYHQESLCTGAEIVQCVRDGRADIGSTIPSYTAGYFPISELMNLPFHSSNPEAVMQAFHALEQQNEQVQEEAAQHGLRTLWYNGVDVAIVGGNRSLDSIEDFAGLAVRSAGEGSQWAYEAIGGNPVSVTASEMYEGMQHGLLDVWTNNLSGADDYNMFEVSDQWALTGIGVYINNAQYISESTWDDLPPDVQQVFTEVSEELISGAGFEQIGAGLQEKCDNILDSGRLESWVVWPEEETSRWSDELGNRAIENWKSNVSSVVDDPDALYDEYLALLDEAEAASSFVSPAQACAERL